jgi:type VI secretion system protein VasD
MRNRRSIPFIRVAAMACMTGVALSGCGAWQAVSDTSSNAYRAVFFRQVKTLDVDLTTRASLNPDDAGRATSVAVRVYQLKDRQMFDRASYDDLLKNDRTVLAQDCQASMSSVLNPAASASLSQPMRPDTEYVAIATFFRDPGGGDGWKYVIEKKKLDAQRPLKLVLADQSISVAGDAARRVDTGAH